MDLKESYVASVIAALTICVADAWCKWDLSRRVICHQRHSRCCNHFIRRHVMHSCEIINSMKSSLPVIIHCQKHPTQSHGLM